MSANSRCNYIIEGHVRSKISKNPRFQCLRTDCIPRAQGYRASLLLEHMCVNHGSEWTINYKCTAENCSAVFNGLFDAVCHQANYKHWVGGVNVDAKRKMLQSSLANVDEHVFKSENPLKEFITTVCTQTISQLVQAQVLSLGPLLQQEFFHMANPMLNSNPHFPHNMHPALQGFHPSNRSFGSPHQPYVNAPNQYAPIIPRQIPPEAPLYRNTSGPPSFVETNDQYLLKGRQHPVATPRPVYDDDDPEYIETVECRVPPVKKQSRLNSDRRSPKRTISPSAFKNAANQKKNAPKEPEYERSDSD